MHPSVYVCMYYIVDFCLPGPMRTSPTAPKTVPTPQRQINVAAAARRNAPMARNGGDAELIELNQQVQLLLPEAQSSPTLISQTSCQLLFADLAVICRNSGVLCGCKSFGCLEVFSHFHHHFVIFLAFPSFFGTLTALLVFVPVSASSSRI